MTRPTKEQAIERLQKALDEIPSLKQMRRASPELTKWHRNTSVAIQHTFPNSNEHIQTFRGILYSPRMANPVTSDRELQEAYVRGLDQAKSILESMIEEIEEYWEDDAPTPAAVGHSSSSQPISTGQVFVVHGRDGGTRETVARFLEGVGLKPIILQEQPNEGRTIIEKFEDYAETTGFAIAICTPDDVGALATEPDNLRPRMRQNVVLELGYFAGKLGRNRVCALVKGNVEKPSDYDGVIYINMDDAEGWKLQLARELRAAELPVDMDGLL